MTNMVPTRSAEEVCAAVQEEVFELRTKIESLQARMDRMEAAGNAKVCGHRVCNASIAGKCEGIPENECVADLDVWLKNLDPDSDSTQLSMVTPPEKCEPAMGRSHSRDVSGMVSMVETGSTRASGQREIWSFGADAYTVGLVAVTKIGLPGALPHLCVALLAPLTQLLIYAVLLEFMMTKHRVQFSEVNLMRWVVCGVCFFILCLTLSNEMLKGFRKMVFSLRCASGRYASLHRHSCILGVFLGFFQLAMPNFIIGLCMQLVIGGTTSLDACINFLAITFVIDIDDVLAANVVVKYGLGIASGITARKSAWNEADPDEEGADFEMTISTLSATSSGQETLPCGTLLILSAITCVVLLLNTLLQLWTGTKDVHWWLWQVPSFAAAHVMQNVVYWLACRRVRANHVTFCIAVLSTLGNMTAYCLRFSGVLDFAPPLLIQASLVYSIAGVSAGISVMNDPFPLLYSPRHLPFLSMLCLMSCTIWVAHMNKYGYG